MNCPRCGAPAHGPFCGNCGLQTGPAPQAPAPRLSRKAAWLVIGGVLGLVLLLVLGLLAVRYGPRTTRPTDVLAFTDELEAQGYTSTPVVLVHEDDEDGTVVYAVVEPVAELYEDLGGIPGVREEQFEEVLWQLWKYLPGHFDFAVVATDRGGSYYSRYMDRTALREEFGARPSGLDNAPATHDGSDPTEEEPGECVYGVDRSRICNRASRGVNSPEALTLVQRTCPGTARLSALPEPAAVRWDGRTGGTSTIFLLGDPRENRPDMLFVDHGGDPEAYLTVSCTGRDTVEYATYTRREYETALR